MSGIFDDERHRKGRLLQGHLRGASKLSLKRSKMLDGYQNQRALFSRSETILPAMQSHGLIINRS